MPHKNKNRLPQRKSPTGRFLMATCRFGLRLRHDQLEHFKGALIQKADALRWQLEALGMEPSMLHGRDDNHPDWSPAPDRAVDRRSHVPVLNEPPLLWLRIADGQAAIAGLQRGARALQAMLLLLGGNVRMEGRSRSLWPWELRFAEWPAGPAPQPQAYAVERWAFLSTEDDLLEYDRACQSRQPARRIAFLEEKLVNHIVALYGIAGEDPGARITARILGPAHEHGERAVFGPRGGKLIDLAFETNVYLPPEAALGAATRMGHGRIVPA